jgi:hypothetical protein
MEFRIAPVAPLDLPLDESMSPQFSKTADGLDVVRVQVSSQTQVDAIVDRVRSQKASLVQVRRVESTLEDAFLAMVDRAPNE